MTRRKPNYLKCIVIVHGKSEKQICNYIKSKLRFHMEIIGKEKGKSQFRLMDFKIYLIKIKDCQHITIL